MVISAHLASELDHFERLPPAAHGSQARRGAARRDHALHGPQLHPAPARHAQRAGRSKVAGARGSQREAAGERLSPDSCESTEQGEGTSPGKFVQFSRSIYENSSHA